MKAASKKILVLLAILCSTSSFAMSELETKVLAGIITNSSSIKLQNEDTTEFDEQLPELVANQLSYNYEQVVNGWSTLGATNVSCENLKETANYKCHVRFTHSSFKKEGRSFVGPQERSAILFKLDVSIQENGTPIILNKIVTVYLAG